MIETSLDSFCLSDRLSFSSLVLLRVVSVGGGSEREGVCDHSDIEESLEVDPFTAILVFSSSSPLILSVKVSDSYGGVKGISIRSVSSC